MLAYVAPETFEKVASQKNRIASITFLLLDFLPSDIGLSIVVLISISKICELNFRQRSDKARQIVECSLLD